MAETDAVIVGAGAGGLAAAWRLCAAGARVVVLEAGAEFDALRDYPQTGDDFELHGFPYDPVRDDSGRLRCTFGERQAVPAVLSGYRSWNRAQGRLNPSGQRAFLEYAHVRGVGGSTLHFQGEAHCFHPDSLRMATRFGVGEDWPLDFDELLRYYTVAAARIGIAAPATRHRPLPARGVMPPHPLSFASRRLVPAFAEVGAELIPNSLAILSRPFDRRPACNYCNSCTQGCPIGDKGSADVTFLPAALATGRLDLRTGVDVIEVEVRRDGRARGVVYAERDGTRRRLDARWVILAAGAIETPRLLLLSRSRAFPNGLGNGGGQVGRHFTESLTWMSTALLPDDVGSFRGVPIDGTAWERAVPSEGDGWVGGFRLATAHGAAGLRGPAAYAESLVAGFGADHQKRVRDSFGRGVAVLAVGEWLANAKTFVGLDPWHEDRWGRPVAQISSLLADNEVRLLRSMADTVRQVLGAAGAIEVVAESGSGDLFFAAHTLGTCRIGADPETSVADPRGVAHEVPNLAFADGSAIPSSGSGDSPFLTITAMALRTADAVLAVEGLTPANV